MMLISYEIEVFFFKQKTAYEMRISDWSSDVCSSDLSTLVSPFYVQKGRNRSVAPSLRPVRAGRKRLSAPVHERVHVPGNSASVRVEPVATPAAPCAGPEPASNWSTVAVPHAARAAT